LRLIEEGLKKGDQARARELAFGIATALDARLEELPGAMPWFLNDQRVNARGCQTARNFGFSCALRAAEFVTPRAGRAGAGAGAGTAVHGRFRIFK